MRLPSMPKTTIHFIYANDPALNQVVKSSM